MYTRVKLCDLPTPLEYLANISRIYDNNIYIKRDDLAGPEPGGNKARKLEYILGEVRKKGANHLITCGSVFSNHCRLTAMAAVREGLDCTLVLNRPAADSEAIDFSGNYFLYNLLGVNIELVDKSERDEKMEQLEQKLKAQGEKPHLIPAGGYSKAGIHGYVEAAAEIKAQSKDYLGEKGKFDLLFLATGTGTTQAGLLIGNYLHKCSEAIVGISVEPGKEEGENKIKESLKEYCQDLDLSALEISHDLLLLDEYIGAGYGIIEDDLLEVISLMAREEAILLDPVYSAKAFAGLLSFIEEKNLHNQDILFLHTGGLPILLNNSTNFQDLLVGN